MAVTISIEVISGVQTNWPSGKCHGCKSLFDTIISERDISFPYLTIVGVKALLEEDGDFIFCPHCSKKISDALDRYKTMQALPK